MPPAAGPAESAGLPEGKPFERRRRHRAAPPSLCASGVRGRCIGGGRVRRRRCCPSAAPSPARRASRAHCEERLPRASTSARRTHTHVRARMSYSDTVACQTDTHPHARAHTNTHTHTRALARRHTHARAHARTHTHPHKHTHARTRAHTHAHTHTHTHTRTHTGGLPIVGAATYRVVRDTRRFRRERGKLGPGGSAAWAAGGTKTTRRA